MSFDVDIGPAGSTYFTYRYRTCMHRVVTPISTVLELQPAIVTLYTAGVGVAWVWLTGPYYSVYYQESGRFVTVTASLLSVVARSQAVIWMVTCCDPLSTVRVGVTIPWHAHSALALAIVYPNPSPYFLPDFVYPLPCQVQSLLVS